MNDAQSGMNMNVVRVDYAARRAWLTKAAYADALSRSKRASGDRLPLLVGEIGSFNSVVLYEVEPEQLPDLGGTVVETDVQGLLFFVDWIANGEPMKNPLAPLPNGTGEAIRSSPEDALQEMVQIGEDNGLPY